MRKHIKIPKNLTYTFSALLAIVYTSPHLSVGFLQESFHNSDILQAFFRRENLPFSKNRMAIDIEKEIAEKMVKDIKNGDLIFIFTH